MNNKLTTLELEKYQRQIRLDQIGKEGQIKLKNSSVLVIGAGGLGCPALQYLVAAGVGLIGIADGDKVDASNLQRQVLYHESDIGKNKAEVAALKLSSMNSLIKIETYPFFLNADNISHIIQKYDLILDCSDNFATRYLVNDASVVHQKPLISASIFKFLGQLSTFNFPSTNDTVNSSLRCLFPEPPVVSANCNEIGVLGVVPGILGCLQANECLKIILNIGIPLVGKLMTINLTTLEVNLLEFAPNIETINNTRILPCEEYQKLNKACPTLSVPEINNQELASFIAKHNAIFIDVRSENEHYQYNIGGENIPHNLFETINFNIEPEDFIVLYCKSGIRSQIAGKILQEKGFKNVYSLQGGIQERLINTAL
jgi:sulfur-carrier protein adenylyltransferase/sulfurtransferase